jgi:hypothetical protein
MGGQLLVKAKELAARVTSVSVMGFGVGFKPQEGERKVLRDLFIFLEDRRALYSSAVLEEPQHVVESVLKIREQLTEVLIRLKDKTPATVACRAMRASCRDFLAQVEGFLPKRGHHLDGD